MAALYSSSESSSDSEEISVDMACSFSEFEEDDYVDDVEGIFECEKESRGSKPYQFEPYAPDDVPASQSHSQDSDSEPEEDSERVGNTLWCSCGNCVPMSNHHSSRCCMEIAEVVSAMAIVGVKACATQHPGFEPGCLNEWALQLAYRACRSQRYKKRNVPVFGDDLNQRYRYTAYRQFVYLTWGYLGEKVRVVLPSCVDAAIKRRFPGQDYTGFLPE